MADILLHTGIKQGSKSFYFATRFMPKALQEDLSYLYSICREIDDIGDTADHTEVSHEDAIKKINDILVHEDVTTFFSSHNIPMIYLHELADGVMGDLYKKRYATIGDLYEYCYKVAGTVGIMICVLLGIKDQKVWKQAEELGVAMQITNIIRDISEDLDRGLFFIPKELLDRYNVTEGDFLQRYATPGIKSVVKELVDLSKEYYEKGSNGVKNLPKESQRGVRYAWYVYSGILDKVIKNDYDPFKGRVYLTQFEKITRVIIMSLQGK